MLFCCILKNLHTSACTLKYIFKIVYNVNEEKNTWCSGSTERDVIFFYVSYSLAIQANTVRM